MLGRTSQTSSQQGRHSPETSGAERRSSDLNPFINNGGPILDHSCNFTAQRAKGLK